MEEKEFIFQTVDNLNLNIFKLQAPKKNFNELGLTIFTMQEIQFCNKQIVLATIGESHFIWIKGVLLELLACTELDQRLLNNFVLFKKVCGQELNGLFFSFADEKINYRIQVDFQQYDIAQAKLLTGQGESLAQINEEFPFHYQGRRLHCSTKILLTAISDSALRLATCHDYPYPDEKHVMTESTIEFLRES